MGDIDFGEFRDFVTSSEYPIIDEMAAKEFGLKQNALKATLSEWRSEGRIGSSSEIFESRVSYHRAYSRSKEKFDKGLSELKSDVERYAKLVPVLPSYHLVSCYMSHFSKSKNSKIDKLLVIAIMNSLVEMGHLGKLRRLNQEGGLSHSTFHPLHESYVMGSIDWGIEEVRSKGCFSLDDLMRRDTNPNRRHVHGMLYHKYALWIYSITGYLEYLGIGCVRGRSFVALGDVR